MRVFDFDPVGDMVEEKPRPYVQMTGGVKLPKKPGLLRSGKFDGAVRI